MKAGAGGAALAADENWMNASPYASALVHLALGEDDAVFAQLERALSVRDVHLLFLPVDPKWDRVREDRRFQSIIERCGFS